MRQWFFYFVCVIWSIGSCYAQKTSDERANTPVPFTLADRDRLIKLEIGLDALDDKVELYQKQNQDKFEILQKQLEYQQKQLDEQRAEIHWVIGLIITLMGLTIGLITYIIWDRKGRIHLEV